MGDLLRERLERWRRAPDPVLADLIDVTPAEKPAWTGAGPARRAEALEAIERGELEALPAVFEALRDTRSAKAAHELAKALADGWPADPRLTTLVRGLLEQAPWVGQASMKIWRRLFLAMERTPDVRQQGFSEIAVAQVFPGMSQHTMQRRIQELTTRTLPPSTATQAELAGWRAELGEHTAREQRRARRRAEVRELLEQYRDTGERELLFVLADAWQELGEPRGAYLALSLRDGLDKSARLERKKLLKAHEKDWLGPLAAITTVKERVWRDGFLREARLFVKNRASFDAAADHPAWWQLEHLTLGGIAGMQERPIDVVGAEYLPNLRSIGGLVDVRELWRVLQPERIREVQLARPPWDQLVGRAGWSGGTYALERVVMHASWAQVASILVARLQVGQVVVELEGADHRDHLALVEALPRLREWAPLTFVGPAKERYQQGTPTAHTWG